MAETADRIHPLPIIASLQAALNDENLPLSRRYRALFGLKHHACNSPRPVVSAAAINAIASAFSTSSALLKHEVAYCLGQTRNPATTPHLKAVLLDRREDAMVRHEAAEALGAVADTGSLELLKERRDDVSEEVVVRETCEIAVASVEWQTSERSAQEEVQQSDFASVDPAPPLAKGDGPFDDIVALQAIMLDTTLPLFRRYRAMFTLRDLASPPDRPTAVPAVDALAAGLKDPSALFRHEVAFVFGQLSHPASTGALTATLENESEAPMVRHEAAEALGGLGDDAAVWQTLQRFLHDKDQVVRESIAVALDMAEFEKSGDFEYAKLENGDESRLAPLVASLAS